MTMTPINRRAVPKGATINNVPGSGGWPLRCFSWPAGIEKPRGSILFQGGRGDIFEKYIETFDHWHREGWNITSFDWRGQGGSGRLSPDRHVGHATSFAPWINDLATFSERWFKNQPGPRVIIGHSMGGHLVLRALIEKRVDPEAVVLVAPMLGFDVGLLPVSVAAAAARFMCRIGSPERPAWKRNERPAMPGTPRQKFLTRDTDRYEDELWWKAKHPELELGPPSWAWVAESYRSTMAFGDAGVIEGIQTPVLAIGTDGDKLVSPSAIRRIAARLPKGELKMFDKQVAHEILRERDEVRDLALLAIDTFLDRVAGPR